MRNKGGICATLAAIGDSLITAEHLKYYLNPSPQVYKGGYAPMNGGGSGPESYMALDAAWIDVYYSSAHQDATGRYLQQVLAHELDHLANYGHTTSPAITTHSELCK